jgi:hypothetical protein
MVLPSATALRIAGVALASLMVSPPLAAQQSGLVDEGTFMVSRNGTAIGRESFRIVRAPAPGGQVFQARSQSAFGANRITTILGTDSTGAPVTYEAEVARDGRVVERIRGSGNARRFSVLVQTRGGEASREYMVSNGALLIDDDVIHQFHFLGLALASAYDVIAPRATGQARYSLEARGSETVEIAGARIAGRRFALVEPGGTAREVWLDSRGRLLKVALPDRSLVAIRDDPPR